MTKQIILVSVVMFASGCAAGLPKSGSLASTSIAKSAPTIAQVDYQKPIVPELAQPPGIEPLPADPSESGELQQLPSPDGLTMEMLEQTAFGNNPVIAQAMARVRALRGKRVQVGLKPNPTIGYAASEVGNNGAAGQQGGFVGQKFITAGKLQKNRAVVRAEIEKAEQVLAATRMRVRTDIRLSYYQALVAQQRVELAISLVEVAGEAVEASKNLLAAEEIPRAALLQTEVEQQNAEIALLTAENELAAVWQQMSAITGEDELPQQPLAGDPTLLPNDLSWDESLSQLTTMSPEMATAIAELSRSRRALNRACVEAVPDLNGQLSVQYDDSTSDTVANIQVGIPLPLWNRNQGGIRQAQAEVSVASQNIERVALDLKRRLAVAYQGYSNAKSQVETYSTEILPRSEETFDLVRRGYAAGEVGYLELLTAQRTFSRTNLAYLDALGSLWQNYVRINGLLLDGSLTQALN